MLICKCKGTLTSNSGHVTARMMAACASMTTQQTSGRCQTGATLPPECCVITDRIVDIPRSTCARGSGRTVFDIRPGIRDQSDPDETIARELIHHTDDLTID